VTQTLVASLGRDGVHLVVVGVLALVAAVVGVAYGLVRRGGNGRVGRPPSDDEAGGARGPEA
jgi:hypothetical protein